MQRNKRLTCVAVAALLLATIMPEGSRAQNITIVGKTKIYRNSVRQDSTKRMVELRSLSPEINYDLRYATQKNFTGQRLYMQSKRTYLRLLPARALASAQDSLRQHGLGLKIFDAYRPYAATQLMWDLVRDERYVANPAKGSGHNRGLAVDLTLVDLKTGAELNMGTGFDNFTDTAHSDFRNLPGDVLANRRRLRGVMEAKGFTVLATEWWHFYWKNDRDYEVLDLSFRALK